MLLNRLKKNRSLRIVNLLGLSVIFACMAASYAYVKYEMSYDRFHEKADRIVRLALRYGDEPVDGRIYGFTKDDPIITGVPEIEDVALMNRVETAVLTCGGKAHVMNNFYFATDNFFDVFGYPLLEGDRTTVLDAPGKAIVSRRLARELFGDESPVGKELQLSGRRFELQTVFVSGVFEDFPENTHFHTDLIVHDAPENSKRLYTYVYLLLNPQADLAHLRQSIAARIDEADGDNPRKTSPHLTPLTDIHLHSHLQREMEANGNISYIYIVVGANILLLAIVLFNLWLNAGLIFAHSRRYYQLLRINGASSSTVLVDESRLALALGLAAILAGSALAYILCPYLHVRLDVLSAAEGGVFCLLFLLATWLVSILPVAGGMSATLLLNMSSDLRPARFSLSGVRFMLIAQYAMVMFIVIVAFGISRQMRMVKTSQVGGREQAVLVMKEQPDAVKERYDVLRAELLKYSEIEAVTSSMQLPGSAIRDGVSVRREGEAEGRFLSILVSGDDFLPFFDIVPVAGTTFQRSTLMYGEENSMFLDMLYGRGEPSAPPAEEYVINRSALPALGFASPDEAIGQRLELDGLGAGVGYIRKGRIVGVTDDFTYTTAYEASQPTLLLQRKLFQHCIMVRLAPDRVPQALAAFNRVWAEVIPDYPADYAFLQDVYAEVYHSELKAESLVRVFSLLSLLVANMGLVIIMAFIIRRKTKEIGIRKVSGATSMDIVRLLNNRFILWIAAAFVPAVPVAWWMMTRWQEHFAQKAHLDWWIFALAGLSVCLISTLAVSCQSWRAARFNPVKSLSIE
ncbi:MAG: ABC transporter permease [Prevotellaceae bacterium]|jgi:putative ABC transport system permease protein|nr:ABC transporter permease [Prevotellaceae bacterium]